MPAARHTKHACSYMTPTWDTVCLKLGLPPCPTLTKEAMGLQHVSNPSLCKDRSVPPKPYGKTLTFHLSGEEVGRYSQRQLDQAETTYKHPSTERASSKQDSSKGERQDGFYNSYFKVGVTGRVTVPALLFAQLQAAPNTTSGAPETPCTNSSIEEGAQRPGLCSVKVVKVRGCPR